MSRFYAFLVAVLRVILFPFFPYRQTGRENLPEGACIICANHTHAMDPFYLAFSFGRKNHLRFMAKQELSRIPVITPILHKIGVVFVDRGNSDIDAIRTSMKLLKDGQRIMMFPEGTRVSEDEAVSAKTGAVRLATKLSVPILPVYIPRKKKHLGRTHVRIGQAYMPERSKDKDELAAELMEKIAALRGEDE